MRIRSIVLAGGAAAGLAVAAVVFAAEGAAGGIRWNTPARWTVGEPKPMRKATYVDPRRLGSAEAGECGVFFFGKGQGGSVDENLSRWAAQFEGGAPAEEVDRRPCTAWRSTAWTCPEPTSRRAAR